MTRPTGDEIRRQRAAAMAQEHLPLVGALVRRFTLDKHDPQELYQQGCVGLMKAIARFDPARETSFSTYAAAMILGEMRMLKRLNAPVHIPRTDREQRVRIRRAEAELIQRLHREPTVQELSDHLCMDMSELMLLMEDITVSSTDALTQNGTPCHECLEDRDDWLTRLEIRDLFSRLPGKDKELLTLRWRDGFSQAESARRLGMTQVQVSRREAVLRRILHDAWYA